MRLLVMLLMGAVGINNLVLASDTVWSPWPGVRYDLAIPTEEQVLGHAPGAKISSPAEILTYLRALEHAAPDRMRVVRYGHTWEGRELVYAVISSPENLKRSTEIQATTQRVADPRLTDPDEAKRITSGLPVPVWLAYGVHGNEISSSDAALVTAYHLLAAKGDPKTDAILRNELVLIDPLQNPDGRNRFLQSFESNVGLEPDPNQLAAEHNEPWPNGRTNHYNFDMNRDWFALTQPETQGRVAAVRQWLPLVFVDLHEMGSDSTYYFAPEANPYNPYITDQQKASLEWFGKRNAAYFDGRGYAFFTKEGYDEFYPGYGASWPLYFGSIGMTYEQASTRGLAVRKSTGDLVLYRDTVVRHALTSLSTLETAGEHRQELWNNFYQYRREAWQAGEKADVRSYILVRQGNTSAADKLAQHLLAQGIEVQQASAPLSIGDRQIPQGSYKVALQQPLYRLIRALLDPQVAMDPQFLAAEEDRRRARQSSEMYDVTAWSLPMQYGVESVGVKADPQGGNFHALPADFQVRGELKGNGQIACLVPWGTSSAGRVLTAALRSGMDVSTSDRAFVQAGHKFPAGSLVIKTSNTETIKRIVEESGADAIATTTSWTDEGPNFGSRHMLPIPKTLNIALAWDRPTNSSAAGAARFVLEREFGYPVTVVRTQQLSGADLHNFQVLLLPDAQSGEAYENTFGTSGIRRLREWVSNGGTLVALGPGATSFLSTGYAGLLAVSQENAFRAGHDPGARREREGAEDAPARGTTARETPRVAGTNLRSAADYEKAIEGESDLPDSLHGVLLRAEMDPASWMSSGVPATVNVMVTGRYIFTPIKRDVGTNVGHFASADRSLASGFAWAENRTQLAFKPFLLQQRIGRGNVIGFTADPVFRGYMDGLYPLLLNAVFRGPAHALPPSLSGEGEEQ